MPDPAPRLAALADAAEGLLVPSESDAPLEPFHWEGEGALTPEALVASLGLSPDTPVETRTLDAFFAPLMREATWMDDAQREQAAKFAALRDRIAADLANVEVYRLGRIQITVVIAGRTGDGATGGLRTTLVET